MELHDFGESVLWPRGLTAQAARRILEAGSQKEWHARPRNAWPDREPLRVLSKELLKDPLYRLVNKRGGWLI